MATERVRFRLRGGTPQQWQDMNPVLMRREPGVEILPDGSSRMKVGDGVRAWNDLPYTEGTLTGDAPVSEGIFSFKTEHPVAQVWTVNHNLGYEPAGVFVTDSGGTEWIGEVEHIDANTLTITFKTAFGGTVRVS